MNQINSIFSKFLFLKKYNERHHKGCKHIIDRHAYSGPFAQLYIGESQGVHHF